MVPSAPPAQVVPIAPGRGVWVQVVKGSIAVNGKTLKEGDAAAVEKELSLEIVARDNAEVLLFDLVL